VGTNARDTRPNQSHCACSGGTELARRHFLAGADAAARGWAVERHPRRRDLLALTLNDGVNTDLVRRYTQFAKDTGVRLTYLVNGTTRGLSTATCRALWWRPRRSGSATIRGRIPT